MNSGIARPHSASALLLLAVAAGVLGACRKDERPPKTTESTATTTVPAPEWLELTGPATSVGPGDTQHHATVALRSDGIAVATWRAATRSDAATIGPDGSVSELLLGDTAPVNHPQIRPTDDGYLVAATVDGALGLVGNSVDPGGTSVGDAVVIAAGVTFVPDFDVRDGGGVIVWHDQAQLFCDSFTGVFENLQTRGCPQRVDDTAILTIVNTRLGEGRVVHTWDEWRPDLSQDVYVAVDDGTGPQTSLVDTLPWGDAMPGRPDLAVDDVSGMQLVVWRGALQVDGVIRSWVQAIDEVGSLGERYELGLEPGVRAVEWPNIGGAVDGLAVVAWVEDAQLWLQVRSATTGEPLGDPVDVAIETARDPRRPYVEIAKLDDGSIAGIVTWESAPIGATTHDEDRLVRFRQFAINPR